MSTGVIFEQNFRLNKSIKIFINYLLGPAFLLWLSWDVYHQITTEQSIALQWQIFLKIIAGKGYSSLLVVLILMLIQWMMEAIKWKLLLKDLVNIKLSKAFRTILSGITVSVVTPNRLGEFAGRVVHLPNGTRVEGTAFTFMGNLAQLIVTCLLGAACLYIGYDQLKLQLNAAESIYTIDLLLILSPIATIILLLVYFSSSWILRKLGHWKLLSSFSDHLFILSKTSGKRLAYVLFLSFIRYGIFVFQYLIVFRFVGLGNNMLEMSIGVSVMLLWLSIVPTFSFMEMGVRWQFALLLFPVMGAIPLAIPIAVTIIWLVNFILPAFLGVVSLLHVSEKNDPDANFA